jgi:dimethylamine monooxygenase subunit A
MSARLGDFESAAPLLPAPARYFPVKARPYRMEAGLMPFGRDFGNGERDRMFFQIDREIERYRRARREIGDARFRLLDTEPGQAACHRAVLEWMNAELRREHPARCGGAAFSYADIAHTLQEDFAVLRRRPDGGSEAIAMFVSFPSGWRPEALGGADFKHIHDPVPAFGEVDAAVDSMVAAMIERGPYVRFVWAISADDHLDHHPDEGRRIAWRDATAAWLRVERQVSVPFAAVGAALFLIRTYLYPFASLSREEKRELAAALELMPPEVAAYKGVSDEVRRVARQFLGA